MGTTPFSPCGWAPTPVPGATCNDVEDPTIVTQAQDLAVAILYALTGRQFGCCELVVRPCKPKTCDPTQLSQIIYWDSRAYLTWGAPNLGVLSFFPTLINGEVYNISCGCPTGCCKCTADCEVLLPGPICAVTDVTVDGVSLDPSWYRVVDGNTLIFNHILVSDTTNYAAAIATENDLYTLEAENVDNAGPARTYTPDLVTEAKYASYCPSCQDYNLPAGEIGTWTVTYSVGTPVPAELNFAAGLYANEIRKSLTGDKNCQLPARVQQVARQGINTTFIDPLTLADGGLTGVPLVDQIIRALNPGQLASSPRVWYPGKTSTVRRDTP